MAPFCSTPNFYPTQRRDLGQAAPIPLWLGPLFALTTIGVILWATSRVRSLGPDSAPYVRVR